MHWGTGTLHWDNAQGHWDTALGNWDIALGQCHWSTGQGHCPIAWGRGQLSLAEQLITVNYDKTLLIMILKKGQILGFLSPQDETPSPVALSAFLEGRTGPWVTLVIRRYKVPWHVMGFPGDPGSGAGAG